MESRSRARTAAQRVIIMASAIRQRSAAFALLVLCFAILATCQFRPVAAADWRYAARYCINEMVSEEELPRVLSRARRWKCDARIEPVFDSYYVVYGVKIAREVEY